MDLGISGRVALVAASSKGLGRAVAEELAAEGVSLVLCARGEAALAATAQAIASGYDVPVHAVAADLGRSGEVERVVREALLKFGRVDILVTNSGGPPAGPFESLSKEAWDAAIALVLSSVVTFCQAVVPGMKERRWGRILNICSIAAKQPVDNLMLSNSIRAAVLGFARTLANEVAPFGITVNNLLPGFTRTERMVELSEVTAKKEGITPPQALARYAATVPMGRMAEPREFAGLAAFLASERAAYITGQSMAVDGGWIRGLL
ncbi:MAG TPA: SDR family oxidoreductase [Gemmatimonadales bacterium]|nr:SDR family oxidoreductase [Gemmatimonadales bacterium]